MAKEVRLDELFRDPSDYRDLLEAYGESPPEDPKAARKRVLELVKDLGQTRVVSTLFDFARAFGRMAREVADFCSEHGVAIRGQIQLPHDDVTLDLSALETRWAFGGATRWSSDTEGRANAITAALGELVERLDPESVVRRYTEERVTDLGRFLRDSAEDPVYRVMWREIQGTTREIKHEACTEGDLRCLRMAVDTLGETRGAVARVPLSAGTASGLQDLEERLGKLVGWMERLEVLRSEKAMPWIAGLADEIQILTFQLRKLGQDISEGERTARGFQDFLRTEFWFQRWRIYELWLLVCMLKIGRKLGGEIELRGVDKEVWHLRYGRATEPAAICRFPRSTVEFYYQYWREHDKGADMPDIVLLERDGRGLAVIDPKHGRSYSRSKVRPVLTRYARHLGADLTAIINYFHIPGYAFEFVRSAQQSWILASDIAPGTLHARRLESLVEEAFLARGFARQPEVEERATAPEPRISIPARSTSLLFNASKAREVDEPKGPWWADPDGESAPLGDLAKLLKEKFASGTIRDMEARPDGKACVLHLDDRVVLVSSGWKAKLLAKNKGYFFFDRRIGWNGIGSRYVLATKDIALLYSGGGKKIGPVPLPPEVEEVETLGWAADGQSVLHLRKIGDEQWCLLRCNLEGALLWESPIPFKARHVSLSEKEKWRVFPRFGEAGALVLLGYRKSYVVSGDGTLQRLEEDEPITVSPSGHLAVYPGPRSIREDDGVQLLRIEDCGASRGAYPLVRYTGELPKDIRWSADESRFAFLTRTGNEGQQRLLSVRVGERHARSLSLPGQDPVCFAWVSPRLLK